MHFFIDVNIQFLILTANRSQRIDFRFQLLNRLRQSLEPHRSGTIPVHLYYQRADARARLRFGATWRVSPSDRLLNDLRGLIGSEQVELEFD